MHSDLLGLDLEMRPSCYRYTFRTGADKKLKFGCQLKSARCLFSRVNGDQRCRQRTVMGFGYCHRHLAKEFGVQIKTSTVPNAGKGLFAVRRFRVGDYILRDYDVRLPPHCSERGDPNEPCAIPYWGEELDGNEMNRRYGAHTGNYAVSKGVDRTKRSIDAACVRSFASFINHRSENPNVLFITWEEYGNPVVVAARDIEPGEELFIHYGTEYDLHSPDAHYKTDKGRLPAQCPPNSARGCYLEP